MRRNQRIVYCARNVNNDKCYIGWCTDFKDRKARHLREAEKGTKTRFYEAIRKYGKDAFEWTVLFDNLASYDSCKIMEKRLIALFDTYNNGYNATIGGDGGFTGHNSGMFKRGLKPWNTGIKATPDHIEKLRISHRGKKQNQEQIDKRVKSIKALKRKVSEEHKDAIRKSLQKRTMQLSIDGSLIAEYPSVNDAFAATGINNIAATCRGVFEKAGGFKWRYV
jgi:group I intron endonuclease